MYVMEANDNDAESLANIRVLAMKESLEALGRFDPVRARERFLSNFNPALTKKIMVDDELVGFYVLKEELDWLFLDHLYVDPKFQGNKVGSKVLLGIIKEGHNLGKDIKLGALKGSRSNDFYVSHGFVKTHEEAFDNYYVCRSSKRL